LGRKKGLNWQYGICYLCGIEASVTPEKKLTKDHIPPECFAPEPLASFTATSTSRFHYAWACRACNKYYSDFENAFKNLMLLGGEPDIQATEDAWNKVVSENDTSILKYGKLSKPVRGLRKNVIFVQPRTPAGVYLLPAEALQIARNAEELKVAIKIHTTEIVPQTYEMGIVFNEHIRYFGQLAPTYSRTDTDFFQYLGYTASDNFKVGVWYMRFYKGHTAMVWFRPKKQEGKRYEV